MEKENNSLKKNAFKGFVWKFAERIGSQMVSLIVSIVLARILLPEDYTVVGIVTIFFAFCNVFITGGVNTALIQKKDADEDDYSTIFWFNIILATILYCIVFLSAPIIAKIYENSLLIPIMRVMGVVLFINSINSVVSAYVSSTLQFEKFFFSTVVGILFSAIIGIIMAYSGFGAWALVVQQMSNSFIGTSILFVTTKFRVKVFISLDKLKVLLQFGFKMFIATWISVLYDQISPLIIGIKFTGTDLAYYTKGRSFPGVLSDSITNSLSAVLFPVISKKQDDKGAVLNITRQYISVASYVIFPVMLGFFAVAKSFVEVVLTEKWVFTVPYIQIFCASYMFNIIQTGNLEAIKAIGRSDIILKLEIIKKSLYFIVIALFVWLTDTPEMLAVSSIICTGIATLVNTFPNRKLIGYRYRDQIKDICPNLLMAVIMGIIVLGFDNILAAPLVKMFIQISVGVILYIMLSLITKNKSFFYLLNTFKNLVMKKSI